MGYRRYITYDSRTGRRTSRVVVSRGYFNDTYGVGLLELLLKMIVVMAVVMLALAVLILCGLAWLGALAINGVARARGKSDPVDIKQLRRTPGRVLRYGRR